MNYNGYTYDARISQTVMTLTTNMKIVDVGFHTYRYYDVHRAENINNIEHNNRYTLFIKFALEPVTAAEDLMSLLNDTQFVAANIAEQFKARDVVVEHCTASLSIYFNRPVVNCLYNLDHQDALEHQSSMLFVGVHIPVDDI
jgi:hypothetical protein